MSGYGDLGNKSGGGREWMLLQHRADVVKVGGDRARVLP